MEQIADPKVREAPQALRDLEQARPGTSASLILYPSGAGAVTWRDWAGKFHAVIDFDEGYDLLDAIHRLRSAENLVEDE